MKLLTQIIFAFILSFEIANGRKFSQNSKNFERVGDNIVISETFTNSVKHSESILTKKFGEEFRGNVSRYLYSCENLRNKSFKYGQGDLEEFKYEIVYVPFHTRLEEKAVNEKPTLYIQQPNLDVLQENISFIYDKEKNNKDIKQSSKKILFFISFKQTQENEIITIVDINIPYKFVLQTGLTSFEIFQVHPCNEKYAFISNLVYVNHKINTKKINQKNMLIVTGDVTDELVHNNSYLKIHFGNSNFSKEETTTILTDNLAELSQNNFVNQNLSIVILTEEGLYSPSIQPYFYPPLNTDKIYNLYDIEFEYISNEDDPQVEIKKPIYKRKELPSRVMPGFSPYSNIFKTHKVIKYTPTFSSNVVAFVNTEYPQIIFGYRNIIIDEDKIVYDAKPIKYVQKNSDKIAYNISYIRNKNEMYKMVVNIAMPQSIYIDTSNKLIEVAALFPIGYDFISDEISVRFTLVLNTSTLTFDDYPIVTRRDDKLSDILGSKINNIDIECYEISQEKINVGNFVILPDEYKDKKYLSKYYDENKDIVFFKYEESTDDVNVKDFYVDIFLSQNSINVDGDFKYNCKILVPKEKEHEIGETFLTYSITEPAVSNKLKFDFQEMLLEETGKTYFKINYISRLVKKNQVKTRGINSITEIGEYRDMETKDIYILFYLEKNSENGIFKFNVYIVIPYQYINENFGQPITLTPVYSAQDKFLQGAKIEYIIAHNHLYKNNNEPFLYDIEIISNNESIKIEHKLNYKKLYIKLNGKNVMKNDVDVYYKNDLILSTIKNNSKINVIIEFDRSDVGNVLVTAFVQIPHNFLILYDDPTVLVVHDVDPYYNFSQNIKTITTYNEGKPQSNCVIMENNTIFDTIFVEFDEKKDLIVGKNPRLYVFLKNPKILSDNVKIYYKPYSREITSINETDLNLYINFSSISECEEDVTITVEGNSNLFTEYNPVYLQIVLPRHIHGIKKIKQTFISI
uniref:Translocon component PTEX88 n=1 Tax=Parastrongyloides trichosuri TaxID=131310 RepID=A0A0N4ZUI3_PARTI